MPLALIDAIESGNNGVKREENVYNSISAIYDIAETRDVKINFQRAGVSPEQGVKPVQTTG